MDKNKWNFIIDAAMFLVMTAIAGLGFLMKYVLLNSRERIAVYGRPVDLTFLGLDRHAWGAIHLYLAFGLMALLVLHIVLHWKLIVSLYRRLVADARVRFAAAVVFVVLGALLFAGPLLVKPIISETDAGETVEMHQESGARQGRGPGRFHERE